MRILHVTDASSSGVLTAVTTLACSQSKHSSVNEVVFGYVPRPDSPPHGEIAALAGKAVRVERWHQGGQFALAGLAKSLYRVLTTERFDVIHLHSSRSGFLGRAIAMLSGASESTVYSPHCFSFDRSDYHIVSRTVFRWLERIATRFGNKLVLVSKSEEKVARKALSKAQTAVLRNSVDVALIDRFLTENADQRGDFSGGSEFGFTVVHVGRIQHQKRPEMFSLIASSVRSKFDDPVRFRWLGDGDRHLLSSGVEVSGWLNRNALLKELAQADVMLFTSAGEGMPMSVIEAQAMGVPVVAADVTGLRDVVVDRVTGRLERSSAALECALMWLLGNDDVRRQYGQAAASHIRRDFDTDDLAERSLSAYASLGLSERNL